MQYGIRGNVTSVHYIGHNPQAPQKRNIMNDYSIAARLAKPGRHPKETAPAPGRAVGYLPGGREL